MKSEVVLRPLNAKVSIKIKGASAVILLVNPVVDTSGLRKAFFFFFRTKDVTLT